VDAIGVLECDVLLRFDHDEAPSLGPVLNPFILVQEPIRHIVSVLLKYPRSIPLYNLRLSSEIMSGSERDDFDPKIIEEMVRMFEEMGMPIDKQTLRSMIDQVRDQFENLGIDPSRMAMSETKFELNSNPEEFRKHMESMLSGPQGLGEFLKNMGIDIQVKPTETEAEAEVSVESTQAPDDDSIPDDDVYVDDGQMHITIDISRHSDIDAGNIELSLTGGGEVLQLMRTTQLHPFKHYVLPQVAMGQPHWDLNNGILDITFDLQ
jgi:hypothetical protein